MTWTTGWDFKPSDLTALSYRARRHTQKLKLTGNLYASSLRLHFSNLDGAQPLDFDSVSVSKLDQTGRKTETMSVRQAGHPRITVNPGAELSSDPAELSIEPGDGILIETQIVGSAGLADLAVVVNGQLIELRTEGDMGSALIPGDEYHELTKQLEHVGLLYGIQRIDVLGPTVKRLVLFGDSITQMGFWTDPLTLDLCSRLPGEVSAFNRGQGGRRLLHDSPDKLFGDAGTAAVNGFESDLLRAGNPNAVVIQIGINDLCFPAIHDLNGQRVNAKQLQDGFTRLATIARDHDVPSVCCTILPFRGNPSWDDNLEATRQEVNNWIRESAVFTGVLDFDHFLRDEGDPTRMDAGAHGGDWLHPNAAGGQRIADQIDPNMLTTLLKT